MTTAQTRVDVEKGLYIYLQSNSKRWYARFKIKGKWISRATEESSQDKATRAAIEIQAKYKILADHDLLKTSKRFKDVATRAISHMSDALEQGTGKKNFSHYIQILQKYHIEFFGSTYITSIDVDKLREFDTWRAQKLGRQPAKSTLLNHNAAMQMVFKEALDNGWMAAPQVPNLSTTGASAQRRAHFKPDQFDTVMDTLDEMHDNSRKEVTRQIRELTHDYANFVICTGMRPGTELDNLTWGDIHIERHGDVATFYITVRKGKTTLHTGSREIVCKKRLQDIIFQMTDRFPDRKASDKLFRLTNGSTTKEIGKTFKAAIKQANIESNLGELSLYSLRHSYITWELIAQTVPVDVLARQCGTSIEMIDRHYSHVTARAHSQQLSGVSLPERKEIKKKWSASMQNIAKSAWTKRFKQWESNFKRRGCI